MVSERDARKPEENDGKMAYDADQRAEPGRGAKSEGTQRITKGQPKTKKPTESKKQSDSTTENNNVKAQESGQQRSETADTRLNPAAVLTELKALAKDPTHKAIAESYLEELNSDEDIFDSVADWVSAVKSDQFKESLGTPLNDNDKDAKGLEYAFNALRANGFNTLFSRMKGFYKSKELESAGGFLQKNSDNSFQIVVRDDVLGKPNLLSQTVLHEFSHAIDFLTGWALSSHPKMAMEFDTNGKPVAKGAVAKEIESAMLEDSELEQYFAYPLNPEKKAFTETESVEEELFAQIQALWLDGRGRRKVIEALPETAKFLKGANAYARGVIQATYGQETGKQKQTNTNGRRGANERVGRRNPTDGKIKNSEATFTAKDFKEKVNEYAGKIGGESAKIAATDIKHTLKKLGNSLLFLHELVDKHKARIPAISEWYDAVQDSMSTRRQLEEDAEKIATMMNDSDVNTDRVNDFLSRSTFEQKWGYKPELNGDKVTVNRDMAKRFNALNKKEQAIVKEVFGHGQRMVGAKETILKELGVDKQFFSSTGRINGPYAPLKRFGKYVAVLKSKELREAEKNNNKKEVEALKKQGGHYVVSFFDSLGQARVFADANSIEGGGKYAMTDAFEKSERVDTDRKIPASVLQKVLSALKSNDEIPKQAHNAMVEMVTDMWFQYADQQDANTSGIRRLNRAGYDSDMMRSFLSHARAEAGFLANMQHGGRINDSFYAMQKQAKDLPSGKRIAQDEFNMIAEHYAKTLEYRETPWQDRAMALTSAWQLATSIGYHLTNALQGVMVTIPKLAADFGNYGGAWDQLLKGYEVLKTTGMWGNVKLDDVKDKELRDA